MPSLSSRQFGDYAIPTNSMASTRGGTVGRVVAQHVDRQHVNLAVKKGDVRAKRVADLKLMKE